MLHQHDFDAPVLRSRPPIRRAADATPLTPAAYVVLRRKAAGLREHDLAQRMTALYVATQPRRPGRRLRMLELAKTMLTIVRAIELPGATARRPATIDAVAAVMPLDTAVYWQLANHTPERHPRVCRACGGSAHDHDFASWATTTSCTRCDPAGDGL